MALRTAGATVPADAGTVAALASAGCGEEEQPPSANRQRASAQKSLCMAFRGARQARGVNGAMLARGHGRNRGACPDLQNVSHQQPPDSTSPKSRVVPSTPPVEMSKPVGGDAVTLDARAGPAVEATGGAPAFVSASGGPSARATAMPVRGCFSHAASARNAARAESWSIPFHRIKPASWLTSRVAKAPAMAWRSACGEPAHTALKALPCVGVLVIPGAGAGVPHG